MPLDVHFPLIPQQPQTYLNTTNPIVLLAKKREQLGTVTLFRWIQEPEGFTRVLHGLANACTDTCPDTQENLPGFVLGKLGTGQGELWEDILGVRLPRRKSS